MERGYVYFQDFIPENSYDTRITIIGNRAFGFRRAVRPNDFRASGSGRIFYEAEAIDEQCILTAFGVAEKLGSQSMAFDFVQTPEGQQLIVEISYAFSAQAVFDCTGYWTRDLQWYEGHVWPEHAIIGDLLLTTNGSLPERQPAHLRS